MGLGDCYTYTSIDPVSKLMPYSMLGCRSKESADHFMGDLASRLACRVQLTTDGMPGYPAAVAKHFGANINYAVLSKTYAHQAATNESKRRYSPNKVIGTTVAAVLDDPDIKLAASLHFERANLPMRMGIRRFTQLTNGLSKKFESHMHAMSLHFMHYNFGRIHKSLRVTPAMQAGVADQVWTIEEIVNLVLKPEVKK